MTFNFSIRTKISVLRPIVSHTGSREARSTSLPFDLPMLCLIICARDGSLNVRLGCGFTRNHGLSRRSVNITTDFRERLNAGLTPATAPVFCGDTIAQRLWWKRCVILMGERIAQIAWVVMPNHVHAVFVLNSPWLLENIILSCKGFTARHINPLIAHTGRVWQRDYFDRLVRDAKHLANCIRYIRRNPKKARLYEGQFVLYESALAKGIE